MGNKIGESAMKVILTIQTTVMLAMIALVGTFVIQQQNYAMQNSKDHSRIMMNDVIDSVWTHSVYNNIIIPTKNLAEINSNRLDIQSVYGYSNVRRIDSIFAVQSAMIARNTYLIKQLMR